MKYLIITILLLAPVNDINKIAKKNELKKQAKEAYADGNFKKAIETYHFLLDSMGVDEDGIKLNLANAYYQSADTTSAINYYDQLTASDNHKIASVAYQQRGIIKNKQKKHKPALEDFKHALRKNPYNEEARYNYEILKKLLNEQKQEDQQQNQDQEQDKQEDQEQKQDQQKQKDKQQNQDQKDQEQEKKEDQEKQDQEKQDQKEGEESEQDQKDQQKSDEQKEGEDQEKKNEGKPEEPSDDQQQKKDQMNMSPDKLKELQISEEKAKMILEAMKNQEIQYLQQMKKKATKRPSSSKPDW